MKTKVYTLYEDRQTKLNITQQEMEELLTFKDFFGEGNFILQADGTILIKHYIGYVTGEHAAIQVLPKVYADECSIAEDNEKDEAVKVFFRLIKWSGYESVKEIPDPQMISDLDFDLLEIFIKLFIDKFIKLFLRNTHRHYLEFNENAQFIKGRIDFSKTITQCGYKQHLHNIDFNEFTINTVLNSIFKTVILHLAKKTNLQENHKKLLIALSYLDEINTIKLSPNVFNSVTFNRMNEEYRPLLNMVKLFYNNRLPGYRQGDEEIFSFLVPLNRLFERFAYVLCQDAIRESKINMYDVSYQAPQEYLAVNNNSKSFLLKPDIALLKDSCGHRQVSLIVDAKYKNSMVISQSDIYQMVSYAVHYNCKPIILLYPAFKNNDNRSEKPEEYAISAFEHDIRILVYQVDIFQENFGMIKEKFLNMILLKTLIENVENQSSRDNLKV